MPLPPLRASSYLHSPLSREANAAAQVAIRAAWRVLTTGCREYIARYIGLLRHGAIGVFSTMAESALRFAIVERNDNCSGYQFSGWTLRVPGQLMAEAKAWCRAERGRQSRLARQIGVTPQTLSNWLAGLKRPSLQKFLALKAFLDSVRR